MKKCIFIVFLSTVLLFSTKSFAATYNVDPVYSHMYFRIKHVVGHAAGMFTRFDGTIEFDDKKERIVSFESNIDLQSLDTRNAMRDRDLRSERFFDVQKYPNGHFKSTKISKDKITGELTIRGKTEKVTLEYEFGGVSKDQFGRQKIGISMTTTINRKDFGITYNEKMDNGNWLLGEDVDLQIDLEGILQ